MSQQQPRAPRYAIRLSAELKLGNRATSGMTRNLSTGGVCVEIDRPLTEGQQLGVTLFIVEDDVEAEGARGLELTGSVQWVAEADRGYAIGIKFATLTPAQSQQLANALRAMGESG
jgi:hypothetical protein